MPVKLIVGVPALLQLGTLQLRALGQLGLLLLKLVSLHVRKLRKQRVEF